MGHGDHNRSFFSLVYRDYCDSKSFIIYIILSKLALRRTLTKTRLRFVLLCRETAFSTLLSRFLTETDPTAAASGRRAAVLSGRLRDELAFELDIALRT